MAAAFPPLHEYALAHRCPTCKAPPGTPCDAPRKAARLDREDRIRARFGEPPMERDPLRLLHMARYDVGRRHYSRDVGNAPWSEDREPGRRYDTLSRPTA